MTFSVTPHAMLEVEVLTMQLYNPSAAPAALPQLRSEDAIEFHTPKQRRLFLRDVFRPREAADLLRLDETYEHRVRFYYRVCRAIGMTFKCLDQTERMTSRLFTKAFRDHDTLTQLVAPLSLHGLQFDIASLMIEHSLHLDLPETPTQQRALCQVLWLTCRLLGGYTSKDDPHICHLLRPDMISQVGAIPALDHILLFEANLIQQTLSNMVDSGEDAALRALSTNYGLSLAEATVVCNQAKQMARSLSTASIEDERALMVMRLNRYVERMTTSLQSGKELQGLKLLCQTLGLGQVAPQNIAMDFTNVIAKLSESKTQIEGSLSHGQPTPSTPL